MIRELTGRHVLIILVASFGVVFAVNGLFAYVALGSFPGLESDQAYRRGLAFNDQIARSRALDDLGWSLEAAVGPDRQLTLRFADRQDAPLAVQSVTATLVHPATSRDDAVLAPSPAGPGRFTVPLDRTARGQRELRVTARGPGDETIEFRRRLWID